MQFSVAKDELSSRLLREARRQYPDVGYTHCTVAAGNVGGNIVVGELGFVWENTIPGISGVVDKSIGGQSWDLGCGPVVQPLLDVVKDYLTAACEGDGSRKEGHFLRLTNLLWPTVTGDA